ncbi:hypothetical protein O6H91_22G025300 [Diphasiastrum complanatum]|uniref:Uncharacterized protein n=1 Tax=Diphasiastrum complanatum TaxID=34168 RepID=A0ACC2ADU4_DIPCM|nr:hypothetical protein O6H91_22G025300 [Diphasiastrum complanatum]
MSPCLFKPHFGLVVLIVLLTAYLLLPYHVVAANADDNKGVSSTGKGSDSPNLRARGLILVKVWCVIIAIVATFLAGMTPYFYRWNRAFLMLGTQFSGGIFLTTALVHFLSDADASFKRQTSNPYPFAFVLATFGYLLTMLSDCIISVVSSRIQLNNLSTNAVDEEFETQHDAWRNLWTVCLHKVLAAIAMGMALIQILPNRTLFHCASYAFVFAASTPVGVTIGIIIDNTTQGAAADWIFAISMSIASGVFMYVAVNHLLGKKRDEPPRQVTIDNALIKFMAVTLGAAVMAVALIWD